MCQRRTPGGEATWEKLGQDLFEENRSSINQATEDRKLGGGSGRGILLSQPAPHPRDSFFFFFKGEQHSEVGAGNDQLRSKVQNAPKRKEKQTPPPGRLCC
jgi:hypothetical protein